VARPAASGVAFVNAMQITSLLSRHEHDESCATCGHHHEHTPVRLWQTLVGLVFVFNAFLVDWFFAQGHTVASASGLIGAVILGYPIVLTAIKDLRGGILSINELVAIAVLAAFATGEYKTAGVVAFFMLMGEIIETRTAEGARASIEHLIKLTPTKARRITPQGEEEVAAKDLAIGDVIRIRPGDNVAADGVILRGQGSFNQATITGESLPADKKPGDEVFAGTQNLTGVLEIKVNRAGTDTTLGRVRELILAAEKTKLPIMKIVDQYMGFYTPLVLVIAALVWAFTRNLDNVISVIIFGCPCAFILATPTAMVAALSAAARLGILIKNVADIELAAKLNAFVFDKTGTLTTGELAVSRLAPLDGVTPAELLRVAASAERYSNHPTAKALMQLAAEASVPLTEPKDFAETAGRGIKARVGDAQVLVGRAQWLHDNGVKGDFLQSVDLNETEGWSLIFVARDGRCIGWVGLQDQTRAEARESLQELKASGVRRIAMISGDRQPVALRVGREIGCEEVRGECLPQNKVDFVRSIKAKGYQVAVVGDGVNDAPALATANIGVAMGAAGSAVAVETADIALMGDDLLKLPEAISLAKRTVNNMRQNITIAMITVTLLLVGVLFGGVTMAIGMLVHEASVLIVIINAMRLLRRRARQPAPRFATSCVATCRATSCST